MTWRVGRMQAKDDGGIVEALNGIRCSTDYSSGPRWSDSLASAFPFGCLF